MNRMPLFLTGWRYITTAEEAAELPVSTIAVVDDDYLWDLLGDKTIPESLQPGWWDGVVDVQESDCVHTCERGGACECPKVWFETGDVRNSSLPRLPFFAWHPTFCTTDAARPVCVEAWEGKPA